MKPILIEVHVNEQSEIKLSFKELKDLVDLAYNEGVKDGRTLKNNYVTTSPNTAPHNPWSTTTSTLRGESACTKEL